MSADAPLPPASFLRTLVGGVLMGAANLVPGVSGGTMVLAVGLYDRFIAAVADVTRLRLQRTTLAFLGVFAVGGAVAVLGLADPAVWLVVHHRWVAYALFVGLTLGGVPLLLRVVRPVGPGIVLAVAGGLAAMWALSFALRDTALPQTALVFVGMGALASSSMILPGISGSYVLLVFGMWDVVVGSVRPGVLLEDPAASLAVVVPIGVGVVLGVGLLSNVLELLLERFDRATHGVLLGLLLGSVLALWPFQEAVHPALVSGEGRDAVEMLQEGAGIEAVRAETGVELTEAEAEELLRAYGGKTAGELKRRGRELETYAPGALRALLAVVLVVAGFVATKSLAPRVPEPPVEEG